MSQVSKNELKYDNSVSFPNNNNGAITPSDLRAFNVDLIDSTVNQTLYTADSASFYWGILDANSQIDNVEANIVILNQFTASQETKDLELKFYTASVDVKLTNLSTSQSIDNQKWVTIGNQSGSWVTESETGSFARTNVSNTFTADQTISDNLFVSNSFTSNRIATNEITSSNSVITNTLKVDLITSESSDRLSISQDVSLLKSIDISGQLTSSLQQGYVLVGNDSNKTIAIPTASFAGSAPVGTATTGSNTYNGIQTITGSLLVSGANSQFNGNLIVNGILTATQINTTIESSSIIYSSGSNIFGDSTSDTQTLNGTVIVSGSQQVTGSVNLKGNQNIIGQLTASALRVENNTHLDGTLTVTNDTLINGDVTIQSSTPNLKLRDTSGGGFSSGYDVRVDTGSFEIYDDTHDRDVLSDIFNPSTSKHTTSLTSQIIVISGSDSVTIQGNLTASLQEGYIWVGNGSNKTIAIPTASFATTGSNTFNGNEIYSGSVRGVVNTQTITSNTASLDFSTANFFELTLAGSTTTRIEATNIQPGQTINVKVKQPTPTTGSVVFSNQFDFPQVAPYIPTTAVGAVDILTFITFDTGSIYSVAVKNLI